MKKFILLLFPLVLGFYSCGSDSKYELFAYENSNGDWGYFDREGQIVITPQFESAYTFHDGKARVEVEFNGKSMYTFIDKKGNYDFSKKMLKAASATQTGLTRRLKIHSLRALRWIKWLCSAKTTAQKNPTSFDP